MIVTLDTAILVRTNAKAAGPARELLLLILETGTQLVLSCYLLEEARRVLSYPRIQKRYRLSDSEISHHIHELERMSKLVVPLEGRIVKDDEADDPVVLTAAAAGADVLCTLDKHFYTPDVLSVCSRHRIRVMTDIELLHLLRSQQ